MNRESMNNSVKSTNPPALRPWVLRRAYFIGVVFSALLAVLVLSGCVVPLCGIGVVNASRCDVRELYIVDYARDVRLAEDDYTAIQWGQNLLDHTGNPLAPGAFPRGVNIPFRSHFEHRFAYVKVGKDADTSSKIGFSIKSGHWYVISYNEDGLHLKHSPLSCQHTTSCMQDPKNPLEG